MWMLFGKTFTKHRQPRYTLCFEQSHNAYEFQRLESSTIKCAKNDLIKLFGGTVSKLLQS